jgi:hypothetical protein
MKSARIATEWPRCSIVLKKRVENSPGQAQRSPGMRNQEMKMPRRGSARLLHRTMIH